MWRFHPQTARMLELVRSGTIGQLRHVNARFGFNLDPGPGTCAGARSWRAAG